jgi:hypothetical protein
VFFPGGEKVPGRRYAAKTNVDYNLAQQQEENAGAKIYPV